MPGSPISMRDMVSDGLSSWEAAPFLKMVTDIVPNVIYIFNQQSQSNEYTNRSIAEALGYSSQEIQRMGSDMIPFLCHPDDLNRVAAQFRRITQLEDGEVARVEYRVRRKNGDWAWLQSVDTVFDRDGEGNVLRHIGVASDVTALKNAEEKARAEQRKTQATNEELRSFAYSVTHDLKAPSNTLNLVLNELLESHAGRLNEDAVSLIGMAQQTVNRMENLVEDVLDYTRVIGQEFEPAKADLNVVLRDVLDALSDRITAREARIDLHTLPVVMADQAQLVIFFQKLVENAIMFGKPNTPPQIKVTWSAKPNRGAAEITVQDHGIGIHASKHEYVFEIFKKLNIPRDHGGSGLGLPICRRIALNHGSNVTLVSAPDDGAAFSIELPLAD